MGCDAAHQSAALPSFIICNVVFIVWLRVRERATARLSHPERSLALDTVRTRSLTIYMSVEKEETNTEHMTQFVPILPRFVRYGPFGNAGAVMRCVARRVRRECNKDIIIVVLLLPLVFLLLWMPRWLVDETKQRTKAAQRERVRENE